MHSHRQLSHAFCFIPDALLQRYDLFGLPLSFVCIVVLTDVVMETVMLTAALLVTLTQLNSLFIRLFGSSTPLESNYCIPLAV